MGRTPCCDRDDLKKGPWTPEEDQKLVDYIQKHGQGNWRTLPKKAGLARCGKSCRLRWTNYLRPDIKRGRFSFEEEETIIQLHSMLGNKWSAIAARLPGRTDNEIKNYWNTHIRKRLLRMGIDPVTHSPRLDLLDLSSLLAPPFCNPAPEAMSPLQLNFSRLLAGLDGDLLLMATNLILSQYQNPNLMLSDQGIPPPDQQQQLLDQLIPPQQSFDEAQWTQCSNAASQLQAGSNSSPWQAGDVITQQSTGNNPMMPDPSSSLTTHLVNASYVYGANDSGQQSYWSTPASSSLTPLNSQSTTTYVNSGAEDEMESYCSSLFHFQIPDDVSNPIL